MSRKSKNALMQMQLQAEQQALLKQSSNQQRQLGRNDAELAALMEINRSLHVIHKAILESSQSEGEGELILLDLGQGKLRLTPDGSDALVRVKTEMDGSSAEHTMDQLINIDKDNNEIKLEAGITLNQLQQELCIDFLLHRKLRRKLLSRVMRRTQRLATSMDGALDDLPQLPKYGDLRLKCDPGAVEAFRKIMERQQEALRRMDFLREQDYKQQFSSETEINSYTSDRKVKEEEESKDIELNTKYDESAKTEGKFADQPQSKVFQTDSSESIPAAEYLGSPSVSRINAEEQGYIDYTVLQDYKDFYDKNVESLDDTNHVQQYSVIKKSLVEDYSIMKGSGIGAMNHSMSAAEKEKEFKRWQTTLLARIPEQPTYLDLGLEHRVFSLDKRRERAFTKLEKVCQHDSMKKTDSLFSEHSKISTSRFSGTVQKNDNQVSPEANDVDMTNNDYTATTIDKSKLGNTNSADISDPDNIISSDKIDQDYLINREDTPELNNKGDVNQLSLSKSMRPISLTAVPSFYEQDLRRIKNAQADLLSIGILTSARNSLELCVNEYNNGESND